MPIRVILQGIAQASLLVDNEEQYVHCGRGVLMYVAFIKPDKKQPHHDDEAADKDHTGGISDEDVANAVEVLMQTRIYTHFSPETMATHAQSLEECPQVDIMIVPQASLSGKINKKGHSVQFHGLVSKDVGGALYERFCHHIRVARTIDEERIDVNGVPLDVQPGDPVRSATQRPEKWIKYNGHVLSGTFGNRQGLCLESDGPFTHTFDF